MRIWPAIIVLFLLLGAMSFPQEISPDAPSQEQPITILFAGDIMLDRGVEWQIKKNGGDWNWPFLKIAKELQKADLAFANLESIISDKGMLVGSIYSFRANPEAVKGLSFAGLDVLSVANNHSFDYGRDAFADSLLRLREAGIAYAGGGFTEEETRSPVIKEIRGTKIGILAYTALGSPSWQATPSPPTGGSGQARPGIAWVDEYTLSQFQENIAHAKTQTDILVISLHAGEEYQKEPNAIQKLFAQSAIEAGADLVIGHHGHIVQPLEQYKHGWIAYGLGNFVFDQAFSQETMRGAILDVLVANKKIQAARLKPTRINPTFQVELTE